MSRNKHQKKAGNSKRRRILYLIVLALVVATAFGISMHLKEEKAREAEIAKEKAEQAEKNKEEMAHITLGFKGSNPAIVREGDPYIESGAFALDDRDGKIISLKEEGADKIDTSKPGTYKVSYIYSKNGAKDKITREVKVVEKDKFTANKDGVPVLMYHYVYTDSDKPENINNNYINQSMLEEHLKYLTENKFYFPSFSELRAYVDGKIDLPEKSAILSFDDGQMGFLKYGIPTLEKYKVPATSFYIGVNGIDRIKEYHSPYVCYESHSYDMHRGGGNIGHGGRISAMTKDEIKDDLAKIAKMVGSNDAFAYPYGDVTEDALQAVKENEIKCSFTTKPGKVEPGMDPRQLPRVRVIGDGSLASYIASVN